MVSVDYSPEKHITVEEVRRVAGFSDADLENKLRAYESEGKIHSYGSNGTSVQFMDRLDLGRDVHASRNGINGKPKGLTIKRYYTEEGKDPFESSGPYEKRTVKIKGLDGKVVFQQEVSVPESWSDQSAKVVAQKYLLNPKNEDWKTRIPGGREQDVRQLYSRVTKFFGEWGEKLGYFATPEDRKTFEDELNYIQANQRGAFNSPVYFNAGIWEAYGIPGSEMTTYAINPKTGKVEKLKIGEFIRPQCHACFIAGPDDNLESLAEHYITEMQIFARGSGIGQNTSNIRSKGEPLSAGGEASGPICFEIGYDTQAGAIKSAGKTRRAARWWGLNVDHPDIEEFSGLKVKEDYKGITMLRAGLDGGKADMDGDVYTTVKMQNTNITVRVPNRFIDAVKSDGTWDLKFVKNGKVSKTISALELMKRISFGAWRCGDPGMQYIDAIDEHNTCPNSGVIRGSNPCSEYLWHDDTSCNLASVNLLKHSDVTGKLNQEAYKHSLEILLIAQDIANTAGSYPTEKIAQRSPEFRTTGLGYANLGALLMRKGLPYDSEEGRAYASFLTAILHGQANLVSTRMARDLGTFVHYELNKREMQQVMQKHRGYLDTKIRWDLINDEQARSQVTQLWDEVLKQGEEHGFRNSQVTVLAPTGTIAFLMGCDTTGVEPALGLVTYKNLSGGGNLKLTVAEVPNALKNLGYTEKQIKDITDHIAKEQVAEGAPHLSPKHYPVFDTAFPGKPGARTIHHEGHIRMIGATQPWISGAISKTINLPETATVKDVMDGYLLGSELGIKALSLFRNNSKPTSAIDVGLPKIFTELKRGEKRPSPRESEARTIELEMGQTRYQIIISEYEDGTPAKVFLNSYKSGSQMNALLTLMGVSVSKQLQFGMPLEKIVDSLVGQEFEPRGITNDPNIRIAGSIADYLGRKLAIDYLGKTEYATDGKSIVRTELRGARNGAIRAFERAQVDSWNMEQVLADPEFGGFVKADPEVIQIAHAAPQVGSNGSLGKSGNVCKACGNQMRQITPLCFQCDNCLTPTGSCSG